MRARDLRVCFVGDSFVAGTGDSSALGWVGRVTAAAVARELPITTYNLGIRRNTSALIAERIGREVTPRLDEATDPRVVVSFGVNDTVVEAGRPRCSTADTLAAFGRIRQTIPDGLLLVGPPAVHDDEQNDRIAVLNARLQEEAATTGIPFVNAFPQTLSSTVWRTEAHVGDGFHPDAAGYRVLADAVTTPILNWLAE